MTGEAPKINPKFNSEIIKNRIIENSIPITETGCWIWLNYTGGKGYGEISIDNKTIRTHRISYLVYKGHIPKGLYVCHHCDTPSCINPHHLFLGTQKDNQQDSIKKGRHINNKKRQECPQGHTYLIENMYIYKNRKFCKICCQERSNKKYWIDKEKGLRKRYDPQKRRERYLRSVI